MNFMNLKRSIFRHFLSPSRLFHFGNYCHYISEHRVTSNRNTKVLAVENTTNIYCVAFLKEIEIIPQAENPLLQLAVWIESFPFFNWLPINVGQCSNKIFLCSRWIFGRFMGLKHKFFWLIVNLCSCTKLSREDYIYEYLVFFCILFVESTVRKWKLERL